MRMLKLKNLFNSLGNDIRDGDKKSHPVYGNAILMLKFTNEENMKQAD